MNVLDLIRKGKIKRYFRATRKLNAPNVVSHITQRAAGKERPLHNPSIVIASEAKQSHNMLIIHKIASS
ncbi:MAG: hypothetical protein QME06_11265, partial [Desulfobacterales bacterium]|nr:hypothetical protein [Desulfobacterales bacterium]